MDDEGLGDCVGTIEEVGAWWRTELKRELGGLHTMHAEVTSRGDANAVELREASRPSVSGEDSFPQYFVSNEIVYVIEGFEPNAFNPHSVATERYMSGNEWFKVFLHIDRDGDSCKYVATIMRAPQLLDQPRYVWVTNPVHEEMKARVFEKVV
ncbi:MAG TPA: hypothetical protein VIB47_07745, partial [Dehalococcoidia bacterium]